MKLILQSPYLTLEYLYWRTFNLKDDPWTGKLSAIKATMEVETNDISSRNLLAKIVDKGKTIYYLKQYGSELTGSYLENESNILQLLAGKGFKSIVDTFFYDESNKILVTANFDDSYTLEQLLPKAANFDDLETVTALIASVHKLIVDRKKLINPPSYKIVKVDLPDKKITTKLKKDLRFLERKWTSKCLIHFDPRTANFLKKDTDIKIIDWELAIYGDPMWDLAIFMNSVAITLGGTFFYEFANPSALSCVINAVQTICKKYKEDAPQLFALEKLIVFFRLQNMKYYDTDIYLNRIEAILSARS